VAAATAKAKAPAAALPGAKRDMLAELDAARGSVPPPYNSAAPVAPRAPVKGLGAAAAKLPAGAPGATVPAPTPAVDALSPESKLAQLKKLSGVDETEEKRYTDELRARSSPEAQKEAKREDMWMALAEIGANMAATKSSSFLQAAGEAARAALPGVAASAKERKAELRDNIKEIRESTRYSNTQKREMAAAAIAQSTEENKIAIQQKQFLAEIGFKEKDLASRERMSMAQIGATLAAARINAGAAKSDMERYTRNYVEAYAPPGATKRDQMVLAIAGGNEFIAQQGKARASSNPDVQALLDPPNTSRPVAGGRGARPPPAGFNVD
jgi:hypothetical protein